MKKFAILLLMTIYGCSDSVFSDSMDFADNRWPQTQAPTFDFAVDNAGSYEIFVEISHVYGGIPLASVPMTLELQGPASETFDFDLGIIKDGKHIGDCTGDYCDLKVKVATLELPSGKYSASISQSFDHEYLPNVLRAGITVSSAQ